MLLEESLLSMRLSEEDIANFLVVILGFTVYNTNELAKKQAVAAVGSTIATLQRNQDNLTALRQTHNKVEVNRLVSTLSVAALELGERLLCHRGTGCRQCDGCFAWLRRADGLRRLLESLPVPVTRTEWGGRSGRPEVQVRNRLL